MKAVWYEDTTMTSLWRDPSHSLPRCPHLHIHDWRALIELLNGCQ